MATQHTNSPGPRNWGAKPPSPFGQQHAYDAAGTVAAPLLAGFSLTTAITILKDYRSFGYPEIALIAFVLATGLMLTALQSTFALRMYYWTKADLDDWFEPLSPAAEQLYREQHVLDMRTWSHRRLISHVAYNLGMLAFLTGTAAALAPPSPDCELAGARNGAAVIALLFLLIELAWWLLGVGTLASDTWERRTAAAAVKKEQAERESRASKTQAGGGRGPDDPAS